MGLARLACVYQTNPPALKVKVFEAIGNFLYFVVFILVGHCFWVVFGLFLGCFWSVFGVFLDFVVPVQV